MTNDTIDFDHILSEVEQNYKAVNKNLLVTPIDVTSSFDNGLAIKEVRGKKDIVCGIVELAEINLKVAKKAMCWFPAYAGIPIKLPINDEKGHLKQQEFLIVAYEDILIFDKNFD